jgi:hypothetical protein
MDCAHDVSCYRDEEGAWYKEEPRELITACKDYIFLEVNPPYLAVDSPTTAAYLENRSCAARVA